MRILRLTALHVWGWAQKSVVASPPGHMLAGVREALPLESVGADGWFQNGTK